MSIRKTTAEWTRHASNACRNCAHNNTGIAGDIASVLFQPLRDLSTVLRSGKPPSYDPY